MYFFFFFLLFISSVDSEKRVYNIIRWAPKECCAISEAQRLAERYRWSLPHSHSFIYSIRKFHWARLKDVRLAPNDSKYQLNVLQFLYLYFVPWRYFDFSSISFDTNREYYAYILCFFTSAKVLCSFVANRHTGDR